MLSAQDAWRVTLGHLQTQLDPARFDTWLKGSDVLAYEDGEFMIRVPHAYAKDWLTKHLKRQITKVLGDVMGRTVRVNFTVFLRHEATVDESAGPLFALAKNTGPQQLELFNVASLTVADPAPAPAYSTGIPAQDGAQTQFAPQPSPVMTPAQADPSPFPDYSEWDPRFNDIRYSSSGDAAESQFDAHYSFETLATGPENRFAVLAAQEVATKTDNLYNPLVIHGGVGVGKTHLLYAIGHKSVSIGRKVRYVTAEAFTNEMVESIQNKTTGEFRERYRAVDLLLVDDIQFMMGKSKSEEEFYHTLNSIVRGGGQVVIVSNQHPGAMVKFDERLRAHLEGGLIVDLHPPEYPTRRAILQAKAREKGINLPDDVTDILARHPVSNVRELGGLLKQVIARATLINQPLTPEWAEAVLEMSTNSAPTTSQPTTVEAILQAVASHCGLTLGDLRGKGRTKAVTHARHVAMYMARDITEASYPQIAEALGGRSHSTIVYGYKKIAGLLATDTDLNEEIATIRTALGQS